MERPRSSGSHMSEENLLRLLGPKPERKPSLQDIDRELMTDMGVSANLIAQADKSPSLAEACHEFLGHLDALAEAFNGSRKRLAFCIAHTVVDGKSAPAVQAFLNDAFCGEPATA